MSPARLLGQNELAVLTASGAGKSRGEVRPLSGKFRAEWLYAAGGLSSTECRHRPARSSDPVRATLWWK